MNESRIDTIDIPSRALEKTMAMKVYVPANGIGEMPVLYLMHGRSGDENMMNVLDIPSAADKMIAAGAIRPMVIVCPRMDDALGLDAYESYFFDEIIPLIERRYHTGVSVSRLDQWSRRLYLVHSATIFTFAMSNRYKF